MTARLEFWFEFASTYSYLSAMRINAAAALYGVEVEWKPFLLGPIFAAQGWDTSPFSIYPAKGRYMWRDIERRAARFDIPFRRPDPDDPRAFPQHSVLAARMALVALESEAGEDFCRRVYLAEFAEGRDISDPDVLDDIAIASGLGIDLRETALSPDNKQRLRRNTEAAISHGFFGAPTFMAGGEMFWGDDRLEDALEWASVD